MHNYRIITIVLLIALFTPTHAFAQKQSPEFKPRVFAFRNGVAFGNFDQEATILKTLGYDGVGSVPTAQLRDRIIAYNTKGLKVFSIYVSLGDPKIPAAMEQLKGTGATIELTIRKKITPETVQEIQVLAALAEKAGLRIAFYPHAGFTIATIDPALDLIKQVNHPNVGLMFNLCHYLKSEDPAKLEDTIARAGKHIFAASTCGADTNGKNWSALIQPLDKGTFDQSRLLNALQKVGFQGAIGLQCYAIKGDKRENLKRSIKAWNLIIAAVNK